MTLEGAPVLFIVLVNQFHLYLMYNLDSNEQVFINPFGLDIFIHIKLKNKT